MSKKEKKYRIFSKGLWSKFPENLADKFRRLPIKDQVVLAPEFAAIAMSLGLTEAGEAAIALVDEDRARVEQQAQLLARNLNRRRLMIARLCDRLRESQLTRQLHGCPSTAAYRRSCDQRLGLSPSAFSFLAAAGKGYRLYAEELRNGIGGEAGVDEEFLAKSLAKLAIYGRVKEARKEDEKAALIGFKKEPYRLFKRLLVTAEPEILVTYKDQQAMLTAQQSKTESAKVSKSARTSSAVEPRTLEERDIRRIIAHGGMVHLLTSSRPEALEGIEAELKIWRRALDEKNRNQTRKGAAPSADADLLESKVALDIEDFIRTEIARNAPDRRTLAILIARLRDEPFFYLRWHERSNSFFGYASQVLGIGEEARDLIRIGRNLIRFPSILEGQEGFGTDTHFYSLRYLDEAMANHRADVVLIRARLKELTTREFAEFARDPAYDEHGTCKRFSAKREALVIQHLCEANNQIDQGKTVKVIEILSESERNVLASLLSKAEGKLADQTHAASGWADNAEVIVGGAKVSGSETDQIEEADMNDKAA